LFVSKEVLCFIGIPETFLTAFQGLRLIGHIKKGDFALIHAGAR
jgi:NADPH:quinone reductase-like Zn-dependent oxidoreductase